MKSRKMRAMTPNAAGGVSRHNNDPNFWYPILLLYVSAVIVWGQIIPIDSVRLNRPDGVPADSGRVVTITGVVTSGTKLGTTVYLQDRTAGLVLYSTPGPQLSIGDSIVVTGHVDFYRGLTELKNFDYTLAASNRPFDTITLLATQLGETARSREVNEGRLVRIRNVLIDTTPGLTFTAGKTYPIRDISGVGRLYVATNTDLVGQPIPQGSIDAIGCVGQFANLGYYWSGYQLVPRMHADLGAPPQSNLVTIAEAFADEDRNWIPDRLGQRVTVTGIVTVPCSVFSRTRTSIYIQDPTAGINVYSYRFRPDLKLGDSLIVTGICTLYAGSPELKVGRSPDTIIRIAPSRTVIEPKPMTCRELTGTFDNFGCLVKVSGTTATSLVLREGPSTLMDNTGSVTMYVNSATDIPGLFLGPDTFTVIGIKAQYNRSWELLPRYRTDFSSHRYAETLSYRSIAEIQEPGVGGFSSRLENQWVKVKGRVTGPNRVFSSGNNLGFYIQDSTGGINIYGGTADSITTLAIDCLGVQVGVIGKVTEYNGLTELANGVIWITDPTPDTIQPMALPFNSFLSESMESKLITVTGDVIAPPTPAGGGMNFTLKNGSAGLTVRAVNNTGISLADVLVGRRVVCTGIVGQYSTNHPYGDGYQLMLRLPSDLITVTPPQTPGHGMAFAGFDPPSRVFDPNLGQVLHITLSSPTDRNLYLQVFDLKGRITKDLLVNVPGHNYEVLWDGTNERGERLPLGSYILVLRGVRQDGTSEVVRKLVVLGARLQ